MRMVPVSMMWNMEDFYVNDLFYAAPCKQGCQAAAEEDSLQIVKILMIYFLLPCA
jgi:hypothetical protein